MIKKMKNTIPRAIRSMLVLSIPMISFMNINYGKSGFAYAADVADVPNVVDHAAEADDVYITSELLKRCMNKEDILAVSIPCQEEWSPNLFDVVMYGGMPSNYYSGKLSNDVYKLEKKVTQNMLNNWYNSDDVILIVHFNDWFEKIIEKPEYIGKEIWDYMQKFKITDKSKRKINYLNITKKDKTLYFGDISRMLFIDQLIKALNDKLPEHEKYDNTEVLNALEGIKRINSKELKFIIFYLYSSAQTKTKYVDILYNIIKLIGTFSDGELDYSKNKDIIENVFSCTSITNLCEAIIPLTNEEGRADFECLVDISNTYNFINMQDEMRNLIYIKPDDYNPKLKLVKCVGELQNIEVGGQFRLGFNKTAELCLFDMSAILTERDGDESTIEKKYYHNTMDNNKLSIFVKNMIQDCVDTEAVLQKIKDNVVVINECKIENSNNFELAIYETVNNKLVIHIIPSTQEFGGFKSCGFGLYFLTFCKYSSHSVEINPFLIDTTCQDIAYNIMHDYKIFDILSFFRLDTSLSIELPNSKYYSKLFIQASKQEPKKYSFSLEDKKKVKHDISGEGRRDRNGCYQNSVNDIFQTERYYLTSNTSIINFLEEAIDGNHPYYEQKNNIIIEANEEDEDDYDYTPQKDQQLFVEGISRKRSNSVSNPTNTDDNFSLKTTQSKYYEDMPSDEHSIADNRLLVAEWTEESKKLQKKSAQNDIIGDDDSLWGVGPLFESKYYEWEEEDELDRAASSTVSQHIEKRRRIADSMSKTTKTNYDDVEPKSQRYMTIEEARMTIEGARGLVATWETEKPKTPDISKVNENIEDLKTVDDEGLHKSYKQEASEQNNITKDCAFFGVNQQVFDQSQYDKNTNDITSSTKSKKTQYSFDKQSAQHKNFINSQQNGNPLSQTLNETEEVWGVDELSGDEKKLWCDFVGKLNMCKGKHDIAKVLFSRLKCDNSTYYEMLCCICVGNVNAIFTYTVVDWSLFCIHNENINDTINRLENEKSSISNQIVLKHINKLKKINSFIMLLYNNYNIFNSYDKQYRLNAAVIMKRIEEKHVVNTDVLSSGAACWDDDVYTAVSGMTRLFCDYKRFAMLLELLLTEYRIDVFNNVKALFQEVDNNIGECSKYHSGMVKVIVIGISTLEDKELQTKLCSCINWFVKCYKPDVDKEQTNITLTRVLLNLAYISENRPYNVEDEVVCKKYNVETNKLLISTAKLCGVLGDDD